MPEGSAPVENISITPTVNPEKLPIKPTPQEFFQDLAQRETAKNGGLPLGWQWQSGSFHYPEARALANNKYTGGYTEAGLDTANKREDYTQTLVTQSHVDHYARVFGYGENLEGVKGKRILDVGSGRAIFGAVANYLYGDTGTRVVSIDPAYSNPDIVNQLKQSVTEAINDSKFPAEKILDLVHGVGQTLPFKDNTFDESISNFGVTLVPSVDFPLVLEEMLRVTKDRIQIVPLISFVDVSTLKFPDGIELKRDSLDGFTFIINKGEIKSLDEITAWIQSNCYGDQRNLQFSSSPDLMERRKNGFYLHDTLDKFENASDFGLPVDVKSNLGIDEYGRVKENEPVPAKSIPTPQTSASEPNQ